MSRQMLMLTLGIILVAGAVTLPLSFQANAASKQPIKVLQCDTAKNCKAVFVKPSGDIVFEITNTANVTGGGGGTVDQTARDGVTALQNADNGQNAAIGNLEGNKTILQNELNSAKLTIVGLNSTVNGLVNQVANLTEQLKNAIIDVNVENQTTTGNETGGGTNETGGNQTNNGTIPTGFDFNGQYIDIRSKR